MTNTAADDDEREMTAAERRAARNARKKAAKKARRERLVCERGREAARGEELARKRKGEEDADADVDEEMGETTGTGFNTAGPAVRARWVEVEVGSRTGCEGCGYGVGALLLKEEDLKGEAGVCQAQHGGVRTAADRGCTRCGLRLCKACHREHCQRTHPLPPPELAELSTDSSSVSTVSSISLSSLAAFQGAPSPSTSVTPPAAHAKTAPPAQPAQPAPSPVPAAALPALIRQFWDCDVLRLASDAAFPVKSARAAIVTSAPERLTATYAPSMGSYTILSPNPFKGAAKRPVLVNTGSREKVAHLYVAELVGEPRTPRYSPPALATPSADVVVYVRVKSAEPKLAKTKAMQHLASAKLPASAFFDRADPVTAAAWDYDVGVRVPLGALNGILRLSGDGFLVRTPKAAGDFSYVPAPAGSLRRAYEIARGLGELALGVAHVGGYAVRCPKEFEARVKAQLEDIRARTPPSHCLLVKGVPQETSHAALDSFLSGMGIDSTWIGREYALLEGRRQLVVFVRSKTLPRAAVGILGNALVRIADCSEHPDVKPTARRRPTAEAVKSALPAPAAVPAPAAAATRRVPPITPKAPATPYLNAATGNEQGPAPTSTPHAAAAATTSEVELLKAALAEATERSKRQEEVIESMRRTIDSLNATLSSFMMRFSGQPAAAFVPSPAASVATAAPPAAHPAAPPSTTNEGQVYNYNLPLPPHYRAHDPYYGEPNYN